MMTTYINNDDVIFKYNFYDYLILFLHILMKKT